MSFCVGDRLQLVEAIEGFDNGERPVDTDSVEKVGPNGRRENRRLLCRMSDSGYGGILETSDRSLGSRWLSRACNSSGILRTNAIYQEFAHSEIRTFSTLSTAR